MDVELKNLVLAHDRPTPRYTSYPTAPRFSADFPDQRHLWLTGPAAGQAVSLYFHIPFCARLCYYCGCHTAVANSVDHIESYVELLLQEIDLLCDKAGKRLTLGHVHFGGGSPTILPPHMFSAIMQRIRSRFDIQANAEIAIEADPRQLTAEKIAAYAKEGVNRLSLGTQDFDQRVLTAINRPQPFVMTQQAMEQARAAGIRHINMDLMYGLPLQTMDSQKETIELAASLKPDRISYFGYAHVPWMKKHMQLIGEADLPDASLRYDLFAQGRSLLEREGYRLVGIDHFALPGDELLTARHEGRLHRNFQGYTTDTSPVLLGFGVSAISSGPAGYVQNTLDHHAYAKAIQSGIPPAAKGVARNRDDEIRADVIEQIMCYFRVDLNAITEKYLLPGNYFAESLRALADLVEDGLVDLHGHRIVISTQAPQVARLAAQAFDAYAVPEQQRHARAV